MVRCCSRSARPLSFVFVGLVAVVLPAHARGLEAHGQEAVPEQETLGQQGSQEVGGTVFDAEGQPLPGAVVRLLGPNRLLLQQETTGADGRFRLEGVAPGNYELRVSSPPFRDRVQLLRVGGEPAEVTVRFAATQIDESITVTASRGMVQDNFAVAGTVRSLNIDRLEERAPDILPRMLSEETGVISQQTTPGQGSPVLRGQSAQAVLYAVDGIRYNNATYRAGNTQYLAWIPASNVDGVDVQLGPASVNFGSDALGGAINVNTAATPVFSSGPAWDWSGELRAFGETATGNAGGNAILGTASQSFAALFTGIGARNGDVRSGRGEDSHNTLVRWFGLSLDQVRDILGSRLVDTSYGFAGFSGKANWRAGDAGSFTGMYMHNDQYDVRRYDRLLGGDGRAVADFTPQTLDFGYFRYQDLVAGNAFVEGTLSVNRQNDGRRDQRFSDRALTTEANDVVALGYEFLASASTAEHLISAGAEAYDEHVDSFRNEVLGDQVTPVRPRVPDGSRYTSFGAFVLDEWSAIENRLQVTGGLRFSYFRAAIDAANDIPGSGELALTTRETASDVTFNVGASVYLGEQSSVYFRVARGFRAPTLFDYSEQGLTGGGFEVTPSEAVDAGALIGDGASATALSTGLGWASLSPELLYSYEAGFRWSSERTRLEIAVFDNELSDAISRRTLIVPRNIVGQTIGGELIVAQDEVGRVFAAVDNRPLVSRANIGEQWLRGLEWMVQQAIGRDWRLTAKGSVQRGREVDTGNHAAKISPDNAFVVLRWNQPGGRIWLEGVGVAMLAQDRLNPSELEDARTGAFRDVDGITDFFNHGATDLGLVQDGRLTVTGETLEEILLRVLGPGFEGNSLYTETPGWWTLSLRGGFRFNAEHELIFSASNLLDRNYRQHGSGFDAPGVNAMVSWVGKF